MTLAIVFLVITTTVALFSWAQLAHLFTYDKTNMNRIAANLVVIIALVSGFAATTAVLFAPKPEDRETLTAEIINDHSADAHAAACSQYTLNTEPFVTVAYNSVNHAFRRGSYYPEAVSKTINDAQASLFGYASLVDLPREDLTTLAEMQTSLAKLGNQMNNNGPSFDTILALEGSIETMQKLCEA